MRTITKQSVEAFLDKKDFHKDNTTVTYYPATDHSEMLLYGNLIAKKYWKGCGRIWVSLCGYNTRTTRERLNGFPTVSITTKRGVPYLKGWEMSETEFVAV